MSNPADPRSVLTTQQIKAIQAATQGKLLDPATEKSLRSVFVGNIPYDVTEEMLREIFSQVGPVLSFKMVYDKETGKPKGYGFAEYPDQETAQSAMRNLNNYDINGRVLRVDHATSEKSKEELRLLAQAVTGKTEESPYGDPVEPSEAPEAISRAVASLPPEQMFELMKQMKACIRNNPQEAQTMLLQNPQLSYALLQAQVVMKIVDPKTAMELLHRSPPNIEPLKPSSANAAMPMHTAPPPQPNRSTTTIPSRPIFGQPPQMQFPPPGPIDEFNPKMAGHGDFRPPMNQSGFIRPEVPPQRPPPFNDRYHGGHRPPPGEFMGNRPPLVGDFPQPRPPHPDFRNNPHQFRGSDVRPMDPRGPRHPLASSGSTVSGSFPGISGTDSEKAKVIQQVLKLTPEQIKQLPPEQRMSILALKEQISKSHSK